MPVISTIWINESQMILALVCIIFIFCQLTSLTFFQRADYFMCMWCKIYWAKSMHNINTKSCVIPVLGGGGGGGELGKWNMHYIVCVLCTCINQFWITNKISTRWWYLYQAESNLPPAMFTGQAKNFWVSNDMDKVSLEEQNIIWQDSQRWGILQFQS